MKQKTRALGEAMSVQQELRRIAEQGIMSTDSLVIRQVVCGVLRDSVDLRLTQHPLGFYHLLLYQHAAVNLRLHYWPALHRPPNVAVTPYHDHVWTLQSCVLAGVIENVLISLSPNEKGRYNLAFIQQINGIDCVVPSSERVEISREESIRYVTGESYSMAPRVVHCTRIQEGTAVVTMVRSEVIEAGGPCTLVPSGYSGQSPARIFVEGSRSELLKSEICDLLQ